MKQLKNYKKRQSILTESEKSVIISNMEKLLIDKIIDYLDYLRNVLCLQVSFCNIAGFFNEYIHLLQPYNTHLNPYCRCIKNNPAAFQLCIEKQNNVMKKCLDGNFYGACWAGQEEFVFPIRDGEKVLAFISISGFRGHMEKSEEKMRRVGKKYAFDKNILQARYKTGLTDKLPPADMLATVISPLCAMFELLWTQTPKNIPEDLSSSLYAKIVSYLCYHYTQNISLDDIAEAVNYSKSYIRQLFREKAGQTITQYINLLRIKNAKEQLSSTALSVREISENLGFCNSNYFSAVFKKATGLRPLEYRKQHTSRQEKNTLRLFGIL